MRDFIQNALYGKAGYFQSVDCVLSPAEPVNFRWLFGEAHWRRRQAQLYHTRNEAWLTPVELFAPWYSRALARYLLQDMRLPSSQRKNSLFGLSCEASRVAPPPPSGHPLRIFELGGGNGSNALHLLDYIASVAPDVYASTSYTLVEISAAMAARQRERVQRHAARCRVVQADATTWEGVPPTGAEPGPCYVLALEVLDNLPHDKAQWRLLPQGDQRTGPTGWLEAVVVDDGTVPAAAGERSDRGAREVFRPLSDPLLTHAIRLWGVAGDRPAFVPTGALRLLQTLHARLGPEARLVFADFDSLPEPRISEGARYANSNVLLGEPPPALRAGTRFQAAQSECTTSLGLQLA